MAAIKLGLTEGSAITLPVLRWLEGNRPDLPVSIHKQIEEARMSDGSPRWAIYPNSKKREFIWEHGYLSKTELDQIEILFDLNQILKFQNNNEDAAWYDVVMISFDYNPVRTDILQLKRYSCRIILKEA